MTVTTAEEVKASLEEMGWTDGCRAKKLFELKRAFNVDMEVQPGASSPAEVTNTEFLALLLGGEKVEVRLDGRTLVMERGSQLLIPRGAFYQFVNIGESIAWISCVALKCAPSRSPN